MFSWMWNFRFPTVFLRGFGAQLLDFRKVDWFLLGGLGDDQASPPVKNPTQTTVFFFKMAGGNPSTSGFWHNPNNCTKSDLYGWSTVPFSNFFNHDISRWVWIIYPFANCNVNNSLEPAVQEFSCPRYPQTGDVFCGERVVTFIRSLGLTSTRWTKTLASCCIKRMKYYPVTSGLLLKATIRIYRHFHQSGFHGSFFRVQRWPLRATLPCYKNTIGLWWFSMKGFDSKGIVDIPHRTAGVAAGHISPEHFFGWFSENHLIKKENDLNHPRKNHDFEFKHVHFQLFFLQRHFLILVLCSFGVIRWVHL